VVGDRPKHDDDAFGPQWGINFRIVGDWEVDYRVAGRPCGRPALGNYCRRIGVGLGVGEELSVSLAMKITNSDGCRVRGSS
jgi:hypothetical protein